MGRLGLVLDSLSFPTYFPLLHLQKSRQRRQAVVRNDEVPNALTNGFTQHRQDWDLESSQILPGEVETNCVQRDLAPPEPWQTSYNITSVFNQIKLSATQETNPLSDPSERFEFVQHRQ